MTQTEQDGGTTVFVDDTAKKHLVTTGTASEALVVADRATRRLDEALAPAKMNQNKNKRENYRVNLKAEIELRRILYFRDGRYKIRKGTLDLSDLEWVIDLSPIIMSVIQKII